MTIKLYDRDPYMKDFTADVTAYEWKDGKLHIELDKTAFFPEGGGQPCDLGNIGDVEVEHVYEENGSIFHVVKAEPKEKANLTCRIDWERRLDHMQQHLGQHILSAAFHEYFQAATIGFHLGSEVVTLDLDRPVTEEQMVKAEDAANDMVVQNRSVQISYPSGEELEKLPLRKRPQVSENIRIVEVEDFDFSPCCGTHPAHTGEVGIIKVLRVDKYKGGVRVEFLCGRRALKDYRQKNGDLNKLAARLSVKPADLPDQIRRMNDELGDAKKQVRQLKEELLAYQAAEYVQEAVAIGAVKLVTKVFSEGRLEELRLLAQKITSEKNRVCLLALRNESGIQFVANRSGELEQVDLRILCRQLLEVLEGKGGGSAAAVQGGGKNPDKLNEVIEFAAQWIRRHIEIQG